MKITKLPKNSAANRVRNRCWKTGRPRGYFRYFDCVET
jgi:small subunit ribosomal protein S14